MIFDVSIKKQYGIIEHIRPDGQPSTVCWFPKYQTTQPTTITVICQFWRNLRYSIVFDMENPLTVYQLKTILYHLYQKNSKGGKYTEILHVVFAKNCIFRKIGDSQVIPQTLDMQPYCVEMGKDVVICIRFRKEFKIHSHCATQRKQSHKTVVWCAYGSSIVF